jgi:hypothetical protein
MEGFNNEPQINKFEQAEKEIFKHFINLPEFATKRVADNPYFNNPGERIDF